MHSQLSYFVVMIDYGRKGMEAIVDPEITERGVIAMIERGEYPRNRILFIHEVRDGEVRDVTADIFAEIVTTPSFQLEAA